jgi:hypothetical protein
MLCIEAILLCNHYQTQIRYFLIHISGFEDQYSTCIYCKLVSFFQIVVWSYFEAYFVKKVLYIIYNNNNTDSVFIFSL